MTDNFLAAGPDGGDAPVFPSWTSDELAEALVAAGNAPWALDLMAPLQAALAAQLAAAGFRMEQMEQVAAPRVGANASTNFVSLVACLAQDLADPLGQRPGVTLQARAFFSCGARLRSAGAQRQTVRLHAALAVSVVSVQADGAIHAGRQPHDGPWGRELSREVADLADPALTDITAWLEGALQCDPGRLEDKVAQLVADMQQSLAP